MELLKLVSSSKTVNAFQLKMSHTILAEFNLLGVVHCHIRKDYDAACGRVVVVLSGFWHAPRPHRYTLSPFL